MMAGAWDLEADVVRSIVGDGAADPSRGKVIWDPAHSLWNGAMMLAALVLGPLTFSWSALAVFVSTTGAVLLLGHSIGFHRRLIHRSFDCPRWLEHVLVWLGTLVGMSGPFWMIRTHDLRDWAQRQAGCHSYLSHRSPMLIDAWRQMHCRLELERPPRFELTAGIGDDRFYRWLERTWMLQQAPIALALYALGGWGWVVWGVCARVAVSVAGHWFVGHLAHTRGPQTWLVREAGVQAHDVPWAAIPTMGEAWHNNHHAYPGSARIGLYPGQFDPGFRFIQLLGLLGLAWNIRTPDLSAKNPRLRPPFKTLVRRTPCLDHSGVGAPAQAGEA
jgi:fatty-acid desaturase